jgi:Tol biopolymer transport system component
MSKSIIHLFIILFFITISLNAQVQYESVLSIEDIMKGEEFTGSSPGSPQWSLDSKTIYFQWNLENEILSSLYKYDVASGSVSKVSVQEQKDLPSRYGEWDNSRKRYLYGNNGDIFIHHITIRQTTQVTNTLERESSPQWSRMLKRRLILMLLSQSQS